MQFDKLIPGQLGEYDISPLDATITCNMKINQLRKLVEYQCL